MLKLIQLEWRKNNIGKYIRNAMILAGVLCLFLFALAYLLCTAYCKIYFYC